MKFGMLEEKVYREGKVKTAGNWKKEKEQEKNVKGDTGIKEREIQKK